MPAPPILNTLETGVSGNDVTTSDPGSPDSFNAISATAPKYTNVQKHSGNLSMVYTSIVNVQISTFTGFGSLTGNVYSRFYLYLPSLPSDNNYYPVAIRTAVDSASAILRILSTGIIQMRDASNSQIGSDGLVAVATGQWVRLETRVLSSTTVGQMEYRLYNSADSTTITDTGSASGAVLGANSDRAAFGTNVSAPVAGITHYFDDLAISSTGWIGPYGATLVSDTPFVPSGRGASW